MKNKEFNRVLAGSALVGLFAVHWLPKRLLPLASPGLAALLVVGGLLMVHRNPLKILWKDLEKSFRARPKSLAGSSGNSVLIAGNDAP